MPQATMTSKGQITIPKVVRDLMKLHVGGKVDFVMTGDGEIMLRPVTKSVDDVFGRLYRRGQPSRSIKEMDAGIRRKVRERLP